MRNIEEREHGFSSLEGILKTKDLAIYGLMSAVVLLATYFIKIPTPNGYAHLGDAVIMAVAVSYSRRAGMIAGELGTGLADVFGGYFVWAPFSLVIHGAQGYIVGVIASRQSKLWLKLFAMTVGSVLMIALYQIVTLEMYGIAGFVAALPGNIVQGIVGIIGGMLLTPAIQRATIT